MRRSTMPAPYGLVEYRADFKAFFPSNRLEARLERYTQQYDEETFWDGLTFRLADRDFVRAYGEEAIKAMSPEERMMKRDPFYDACSEEFAQNGIESLRVRGQRLRRSGDVKQVPEGGQADWILFQTGSKVVDDARVSRAASNFRPRRQH